MRLMCLCLAKTQAPSLPNKEGNWQEGFRIRHMTVTSREALLRCGSINSVAVTPEYRQRGVCSAMMTWALAHMRARGWQVTALHAFRESYYRRFGWECAGRRVRIMYPQWCFLRLTCGLPAQQLRLEDRAALEPAYSTLTLAYSGDAAAFFSSWPTYTIEFF
jgi:predicted acetyltransferase